MLFLLKGNSLQRGEKVGVHSGHRERLRARFLKEGLEHFEEHTALEFLLFYSRPQGDTNELAHRLIDRFGGFSAVLDAPLEELMAVKGVGYQSAVLLKMAPELSAYYLERRSAVGNVLDSTRKAGLFFLPKFVGKTTEVAYLACLDDKRKLLRCSCVAEHGIANSVAISTRKIVAEAVSTNATCVIMAHNHPRGVALPSPSDKLVTEQVMLALHYVNVRLLDHIVVADDDFVSLAESGYLQRIEQEHL